MTTTPDIFRPTSKRSPCPVCRRVDGCFVASEDGTVAAICSRIESGKRVGTLGFLHWIADSGPVWSRGRTAIYKAAAGLAVEATA